MRVSGYVLPVAAVIACALFAVGLYLAIYVVPPELKQGDSARIMFVHVPAAAMSIMVYGMMCVSSVFALIWRHPVADLSAKAAAPIGAAFTLLALVTGSIWGYPIWNTWWEWDARLTSELILFFFYVRVTIVLVGTLSTHRGKVGPVPAAICLSGRVLVCRAGEVFPCCCGTPRCTSRRALTVTR
ncbi:UNVERIFIED_CONTAM: hypothetical protein GTU68_051630 [Idotea baltica]|nr:hypothetical protein [Idotea baltica]